MNTNKALLLLASLLLFNFFAHNGFYESCLNLKDIKNYRDSSLQKSLNQRSDKMSGFKIIINHILPVSLIILLLFTSKDRYIISLCFFIMIVYFLKMFLEGQRFYLFYFIFLILGIFALNFKCSLKTLFFFCVMSFALFVLVSISRHAKTFTQFCKSVETSTNENRFYFLKPPTEFLVGQNLHLLIENLESGKTSTLGLKGLFNEILIFFPRFVPIKRDLPLGEKFASDFYPQEYQKGAGYGFFICQEGYWIYKQLGVFLSFMFLGFLSQYIYLKMLKTPNLLNHFLFISFAINCLLFGMRTGILGSIKAWLLFSVPTYSIFRLVQKKT